MSEHTAEDHPLTQAEHDSLKDLPELHEAERLVGSEDSADALREMQRAREHYSAASWLAEANMRKSLVRTGAHTR
jgi:hypothetical protein